VNYQFFVVKYDSSGNAVWARGSASPTDSYATQGTFVTVDTGGNVYVTGTFASSVVDFGGGITLTKPSNTYRHFFVVKYDSGGNPVWAKGPAEDASNEAYPYSIAVDSGGNVFFSGMFGSSDVNFGGNIKLHNTSWETGHHYGDYFVARYDSSGNPTWAGGLAETATSSDHGNSVVIDSRGGVYVTGTFYSPDINFGGNAKLTNPSLYNYDFFVVKYE
jgi:hypothetical protein